jgi:hypothetical protein
MTKNPIPPALKTYFNKQLGMNDIVTIVSAFAKASPATSTYSLNTHREQIETLFINLCSLIDPTEEVAKNTQ